MTCNDARPWLTAALRHAPWLRRGELRCTICGISKEHHSSLVPIYLCSIPQTLRPLQKQVQAATATGCLGFYMIFQGGASAEVLFAGCVNKCGSSASREACRFSCIGTYVGNELNVHTMAETSYLRFPDCVSTTFINPRLLLPPPLPHLHTRCLTVSRHSQTRGSSTNQTDRRDGIAVEISVFL